MVTMFLGDQFRGIREKDIQELYFRHPYLIEPRFEQCHIEQFYSLPSGFADLVMFLDPVIVVVELKIEALRKTHVLQLAQYVSELQTRFSSQPVQALLVVHTPKDDLNPLLNTYPYRIEIKRLLTEIPIKIKICKSCRIANGIDNSNCWKCGKTEWL